MRNRRSEAYNNARRKMQRDKVRVNLLVDVAEQTGFVILRNPYGSQGKKRPLKAHIAAPTGLPFCGEVRSENPRRIPSKLPQVCELCRDRAEEMYSLTLEQLIRDSNRANEMLSDKVRRYRYR